MCIVSLKLRGAPPDARLINAVLVTIVAGCRASLEGLLKRLKKAERQKGIELA